MDRLASLVDIFAIDLCAYAVMSNHYHVVLKVDRVRADNWTQREVAEHWMMLFTGPLLVQRWLRDETGDAETLKAMEIVEEWRTRLYDLGWFMRCLNEHLARRANEEDDCKGRFWEGRYKSQALLDHGKSGTPSGGLAANAGARLTQVGLTRAGSLSGDLVMGEMGIGVGTFTEKYILFTGAMGIVDGYLGGTPGAKGYVPDGLPPSPFLIPLQAGQAAGAMLNDSFYFYNQEVHGK